MTPQIFRSKAMWSSTVDVFVGWHRAKTALLAAGLLSTAMAGVAQAGGIGNLVFLDTNTTRAFELSDSVVPGVQLQLFTEGQVPGTDTPLAVTVTNAGGIYLFDGLVNGNYFVFIPPSQFQGTGPLVNTRSVPGTLGAPNTDDDVGENGIDNPAPAVNGIRSGIINLVAGMAPVSYDSETGWGSDSDWEADDETDLTVDFGFEMMGTTVGDFVWRDVNRNGLQDPGEPGEPGVTVQLFEVTEDGDSLVDSMVTGTDGFYSFTDIEAGTYYVQFPTNPFPLKLTSPGQGSADELDSDASPATGKSPVFTIASLEFQDKIDAGYVVVRPTVGNLVFLDVNADGIQSPGESGIEGVTVSLHTASGTLVGTQVTDSTGNYQFPETEPGQYYLSFPVTSGGLVLSAKDAGGNDLTDSDPDPATGQTAVFTVQAGVNDTSRDAGYHMPPGKIQGIAWHDVNADGIRNPGEPVLAGVEVSLLDGTNNETAETKWTDSNGAYEFPGLPSLSWRVVFPHLAGADQRYQLTLPDQGDDDTVDSDASLSDGRTPVVTPVNGATIVFDAGYRNVNLGIGNSVFIDLNNSGTFNSGEGVNAVPVQLFLAGSDPATDAPLRSQNTASGGNYYFDHLSPGQYFVYIPPAAFAAGAPLEGYGSITGNGGDNGQDDNADENGIDVDWTGGSGVRSGVITLATGTEPVSTGSEIGRNHTQDDATGDANADLTVDFGFRRAMTVGNLVYSDTNSNNGYDAGEGVAGVVVELYTQTAPPAGGQPVGRVLSGPGGFYYFKGVKSGNYIVHVAAVNFQAGGMLEGQKSLPGSGTSQSVDDGVDENGIDAANPAATGISSGVINLLEGSGPTAATGENGAGSDADDIADTYGNLTVDFGFLPGLPSSYAAWRERFLPAGGNAPSQDPDGDGLANAFEYLYALPPTGGVKAQRPLQLTADPVTGQISATLVFNPLTEDTAPVLTWRTDLRDGFGTWQNVTGITPTSTSLPDGRMQRTWQNLEQIPGLAGGAGFVRASAGLDTDGDGFDDFFFHTAVLGWRDRVLHSGSATTGTAFLRPVVFSGTVGDANGTVLSLAGSTGDGDLAEIIPQYLEGASLLPLHCYAEVTGGPWIGHRFEIDEAATSGSTLHLVASSPLNTRAIPDLDNTPIVVRAHWTLDTLFPTSQFRGASTASAADQVMTYPRPSFATYWLMDIGVVKRWVRADDSTLADNGKLPIPPGEGLFVERRMTALTVLDLGEVRPHAMARRLTAGYSLLASGWPVPASPSDLALRQSDGFTGSTNPALADSIQVWSRDDGTGPKSFRSFFLLHGPNPWRFWADKSDASLTNRDNEALFQPDRAFFLQLRHDVPGYLQPSPWTP